MLLLPFFIILTIREIKMSFTSEELTQQKKALKVLLKCFDFNKSSIGVAVGVKRQAVYNWFRRGRISKDGALMLENDVRVDGVISKEEMRPDIKKWI